MDGVALDQAFAAAPESLSTVRRHVAEAARQLGCGGDDAADVVLAVDEALQNIIRHGYQGEPGEVGIRIEADGTRLIVTLTDSAPTVDPERVRPRDLDDLRPGGLGTRFMRDIMDEVAFLPPYSGTGNRLRMTKHIRGRG